MYQTIKKLTVLLGMSFIVIAAFARYNPQKRIDNIKPNAKTTTAVHYILIDKTEIAIPPYIISSIDNTNQYIFHDQATINPRCNTSDGQTSFSVTASIVSTGSQPHIDAGSSDPSRGTCNIYNFSTHPKTTAISGNQLAYEIAISYKNNDAYGVVTCNPIFGIYSCPVALDQATACKQPKKIPIQVQISVYCKTKST